MVAWSSKDQLDAWNSEQVCFQLPRFKSFCERCGPSSPYAPLKPPPQDAQLDVSSVILGQKQVFFFVYECQGCIGEREPIVFMVTRQGAPEGPKLTLSGRSEMEVVSVPAFIPEEVRGFYSDARHAYNCGETFAGPLSSSAH